MPLYFSKMSLVCWDLQLHTWEETLLKVVSALTAGPSGTLIARHSSLFTQLELLRKEGPIKY